MWEEWRCGYTKIKGTRDWKINDLEIWIKRGKRHGGRNE